MPQPQCRSCRSDSNDSNDFNDFICFFASSQEEEERIIVTALFQAIEDGNQSVIEDLFNAYAIDINKQNFEANVS